MKYYLPRPAALRCVVTQILEEFERDGVVYLELRSSPKHTPHMTKTEYIDTIIDCIAAYPGAMTTRYLISIDQSKPLAEMQENADLAILYSSCQYVCGVDLCGNFYSANKDHSLEVLAKCKAAGLKIACHIAEDPAVADHTADLLRVIQPDRLGHATLIDPNSRDGRLVREKKMLIECCMTSNILCKSVPSYSAHHFKKWHDLGHPVLLCTDDSGTFDTSLTAEYEKAVVCWGLSEADFREMNRRAVEWVFDEGVKERLRGLFLSG